MSAHRDRPGRDNECLIRSAAQAPRASVDRQVSRENHSFVARNNEPRPTPWLDSDAPGGLGRPAWWHLHVYQFPPPAPKHACRQLSCSRAPGPITAVPYHRVNVARRYTMPLPGMDSAVGMWALFGSIYTFVLPASVHPPGGRTSMPVVMMQRRTTGALTRLAAGF